jgi:NAD-dependent deacetylase
MTLPTISRTIYQVVCIGCSARTEMAATLDRVRAGEDDPPCQRCGGILKSATVMFGQSLDPSVLGRAVRAAAGCDLMLAVGSTLTVEPAASLCAVATDARAHLVIVNRDPTPYDMLATEVIRDPIGEAIPRITETLLKSRTLSSLRSEARLSVGGAFCARCVSDREIVGGRCYYSSIGSREMASPGS